MLSDFTGAEHVYIACGYTDLRRGIDGLAAIVQQQFALDPFSNSDPTVGAAMSSIMKEYRQTRKKVWQRQKKVKTRKKVSRYVKGES